MEKYSREDKGHQIGVSPPENDSVGLSSERSGRYPDKNGPGNWEQGRTNGKIMQRINNALGRACEAALVAVLAAMAVAVFLQVIFRYVFHLPLFWTEEFARYCLVWASLLGAAVALKRGEHITVTLFLDRFPEKTRRIMGAVARISMTAILAVIMWGGVQLVIVTSAQISPALRIPMAVPYMALPIGSAIMLFHVIAPITDRPDEIAE